MLLRLRRMTPLCVMPGGNPPPHPPSLTHPPTHPPPPPSPPPDLRFTAGIMGLSGNHGDRRRRPRARPVSAARSPPRETLSSLALTTRAGYRQPAATAVFHEGELCNLSCVLSQARENDVCGMSPALRNRDAKQERCRKGGGGVLRLVVLFFLQVCVYRAPILLPAGGVLISHYKQCQKDTHVH